MTRYCSIIVSTMIAALSGCSGGGSAPSSVPPTVTPSPVPTIAPQNFLPFDNQASYEGGSSNGWNGASGLIGVRDTQSPNCAASIAGSIGDYDLGSTALPLESNQTLAQGQSGGQVPFYVVTKDGIGNVYIDGFYLSSAKSCVVPYLFVKSQLRVGDSWTYTDINGFTQVASVLAVGQTVNFRVTGPGPHGGQQTGPYSNVAVVNYGSTFSVYWAAGLGPVESVNAVQGPFSSSNLQWTAYAITPSSTSP